MQRNNHCNGSCFAESGLFSVQRRIKLLLLRVLRTHQSCSKISSHLQNNTRLRSWHLSRHHSGHHPRHHPRPLLRFVPASFEPFHTYPTFSRSKEPISPGVLTRGQVFHDHSWPPLTAKINRSMVITASTQVPVSRNLTSGLFPTADRRDNILTGRDIFRVLGRDEKKTLTKICLMFDLSVSHTILAWHR